MTVDRLDCRCFKHDVECLRQSCCKGANSKEFPPFNNHVILTITGVEKNWIEYSLVLVKCFAFVESASAPLFYGNVV